MKRKLPWIANNYLWSELNRTCTRCHITYKEKDNFANWKCYYHPGKISRDYGQQAQIGRFDCCGYNVYAKGCTAMDHDDGEYKKQKRTWLSCGIDPSKLTNMEQERLWTESSEYQAIYYRPGLHMQKGQDNFKLYGANVAAATRRMHGDRHTLIVGFKMKNNDNIIVCNLNIQGSLQLQDLRHVPIDTLVAELLVVDSSGDAYEHITIGHIPLSTQHGSKWSYVNTNTIGGENIRNVSFETILLYILHNRERLGDPKIAYFTQIKSPRTNILPTSDQVHGQSSELSSHELSSPAVAVYTNDSEVTIEFHGDISSQRLTLIRNLSLDNVLQHVKSIIKDNDALVVNPFNKKGAYSTIRFASDIHSRLLTMQSDLLVEIVILH